MTIVQEAHARSARLDSLRFNRLHARLLWGSGLGWAMDAMDVGLISFVLVALPESWNLTSADKSWIASAGFVGMALGASLGGLVADRLGRRQVFALTLLVYGIATGASALAWGVGALIGLRFVVGLGLGAELPVASTLVSEFSPPAIRGRVIVWLEAFWAVGWTAAALVGYYVASPSGALGAAGWRWALVIGAVPAAYAVFVRRSLPESVRFYESKGRFAEADAVVRAFERASGIEPGTPSHTMQPKPLHLSRLSPTRGPRKISERSGESLWGASSSVVNSHAPALPAPGSGTLTSGNAEGKGRFGLRIRFIHRIPRPGAPDAAPPAGAERTASASEDGAANGATGAPTARTASASAKGTAERTAAGEAAGGRPAQARLAALFSGQLARRTAAIWACWFCLNFAYYGAFTWLPTLLVADGVTVTKSLGYTLVITLAQLPGYASAAWLIELLGRRLTLTVFLLGSAISAGLFAGAGTPGAIIGAGMALSFCNLGAWGALYAVTPEIYPTSLRGTGAGWAAGFGRLASIVTTL
ncbi:MAG: MFS transporter, partial [Bifidobacteriaceae bacterium]|nr:MFS transporter [Bifidobacteriaceae bacterium]